uniref:PHD-type domain-containing protein n=1 Tax=Nelumbo nucifera TaxID=4432 RepID=A0A822YBN3_NELNU|nr:TPA_asm: hypothetical protein HUJ06_031315 [Nelumbo nucifera]
MGETPKLTKRSSPRILKSSPSSAVSIPPTPEALVPRRSSWRISLGSSPPPPCKSLLQVEETTNIHGETPNSAKNGRRSTKRSEKASIGASFAPISPDCSESKKRKRSERAETAKTRARFLRNSTSHKKKKNNDVPKRRVYYKKVVYDEGEFSIGDDVYVKRREDASSDDEDPEVDECRICFKSGKARMIECDDCLGGFHLRCLKPPLKEVLEGDWILWIL